MFIISWLIGLGFQRGSESEAAPAVTWRLMVKGLPGWSGPKAPAPGKPIGFSLVSGGYSVASILFLPILMVSE